MLLCSWLLFLEGEKRTEKKEEAKKFVLQGRGRNCSSHCQEPLAGAGRVFPDINPFVGGGE